MNRRVSHLFSAALAGSFRVALLGGHDDADEVVGHDDGPPLEPAEGEARGDPRGEQTAVGVLRRLQAYLQLLPGREGLDLVQVELAILEVVLGEDERGAPGQHRRNRRVPGLDEKHCIILKRIII